MNSKRKDHLTDELKLAKS